ncbi:hypothetical protein NQ317_014111 [Molorchus minor]|uniref:Uncharacterized protein n=1 Tax=Molorchus minor TaxID=1323400 RepID=A0ABQ9JLM1_9CUCU|nr:hypothetical protein NQ317_014111 [Molorchus minor]
MHFQQDGAPPHNGNQEVEIKVDIYWKLQYFHVYFILRKIPHSRAVNDYLNQIFPNKWIGTHGPIRWPPRSPNSTPMDYFLWGYLKDKVYQTSLTDLEELKNRIGNECEALNVHNSNVPPKHTEEEESTPFQHG